jgi:hypothetical protein
MENMIIISRFMSILVKIAVRSACDLAPIARRLP